MELKSLDGFFWPSRQYFRELQQAYIDACQYIAELEEERAKAGNIYYQQDAKMYAKKYHDKCRELAESEGEKTRLEIENQYMRQTISAYQKALKPEKVLERTQSGQFTSDMTKAQKCKLAADMRAANIPDEEIAEELGIKYDSVRKYVAEHEKNAGVMYEKVPGTESTYRPITKKAL